MLHQLFVTANGILRRSVAKSFRSLQTGFVAASGAVPTAAAAAGAAAATEEGQEGEEGMEVTGSLAAASEAQWPLFVRAHNWLLLLDGTLPPERRFFSEEERTISHSLACDLRAICP